MTSPLGREPHESPVAAKPPFRIGQTSLVFAAFLVCSFVTRPVPSVNEPHYLTKAKHYWHPDWCSGDFFLESSNPHLVFYQTIGALTQWFTLEQSAGIGRFIVFALLAWGWTRLVTRLTEHRWAALASACLFLLLQALGNFSGEWLVGGVESKGVAYAFAFLAFSELIDRRPVVAGIWLGLAASFHPVVGGWCVIAVVMASVAQRLLENAPTGSQWPDRWWLGVIAFVVCSLPGVVPAVHSLMSVDPAVAIEADRYQVGTRLAHHLDPMVFPLAAYRYYALLIVLWAMTVRTLPTLPARRWFTMLVGASLVIAVVGILVGWGPRPIQTMPLASTRIWLLKFYPFRLADILVPLMVSITAADAWASWRPRCLPLLAIAALIAALALPSPDRDASRMTDAKRSDWLATCRWIRAHAPPDALLYTANEDWAVKWFCQRAEYVNYKDCPQDAAGIIMWVRRLQTINRWHRKAFADARCSTQDLSDLHDQTRITHLVVSRLGPIDAEPVYRNDSFRIYKLQE